MIASFHPRAKGLRDFWRKGDTARVLQHLVARLRRRLDVLNAARNLTDLDLPGFDFHPLHGKPQRYSIHVNGPWCVTFEWNGENAERVRLENYH